MTFEWDAYKEKHNIGKHNGITFRTAANVFAGEHTVVKYGGPHSFLEEDRNELNKKRHRGLCFETAVIIFADPLLYVDYDEIHSDSDDRNRYVGQIAGKYVTNVIGTSRARAARQR
ncbi:MAG: hypothetical protein J1D88_08340 [Treponema sp.]|nr:hypothetical protein [Treponema sp.]